MDNFNCNKYVFSTLPGMILIGEKAEKNRNKQITLFLKELSLYKILIKDIVNYPPTEKQKNIILNIAYYISENIEFIDKINQKKDLPISYLSRKIRIDEKFLKKWKEYILIYYIIFSNPDYKGIQDYFRVEEKDSSVKNINMKEKNKIYMGVVIKSFKRKAYIITSSGEFISVKTDSEFRIGEEVSGKEKKGLRHYKIHLFIIMIIIFIMGFLSYSEYCKIKTTLIINITSPIKVEINLLDKVIYSKSSTDNGKELVFETELKNKNVDDAVEQVLKYGYNNKMLPENNKVLITINGQALKYGTLKKTSKFVNENKILVIINNAGNQHILSPNLYE